MDFAECIGCGACVNGARGRRETPSGVRHVPGLLNRLNEDEVLDLLADLAGGAPPELRVVPLEASEGEIHVLIEWAEVPASDTEPLDTP